MWGFPWPIFNKKPKQNPMLAIDVSHYQDHIDFTEVAKDPQGIDTVIVKCSQGTTYVDPMFKYNISEAKKAGLKVGAYHFATLSTHDVLADSREEAQWFMANLKKVGSLDIYPVLDIEENKANLNTTEILQWIKSFFAELEKGGYKNHILYSYTWFLNASLPANHDLGNIPLWIAAYVNLPAPRLPTGWKDYYIWQYTNANKVKGIKGNVDTNKFGKPVAPNQ